MLDIKTQFSYISLSLSQDQVICLHNMTTGHGVPCAEKGQKSFCLNGGICYSIGPKQLCRCLDNYTGERCEEILLSSVETEPQSNFLINFLVLGSFLGLIFLGLVVFCCRRKLKNRTEDGP
ncbi:pro-neuregulin-4, membrane-bound isoform [Dendrobates tinctorius]|uniref:pro-neuregulin-4, membrane-bound isoform n=1 Tax=Dendrobates tinctorius TaxID=92724 RepID=UPI003CCA6319